MPPVVEEEEHVGGFADVSDEEVEGFGSLSEDEEETPTPGKIPRVQTPKPAKRNSKRADKAMSAIAADWNSSAAQMVSTTRCPHQKITDKKPPSKKKKLQCLSSSLCWRLCRWVCYGLGKPILVRHILFVSKYGKQTRTKHCMYWKNVYHLRASMYVLAHLKKKEEKERRKKSSALQHPCHALSCNVRCICVYAGMNC